VLCLYHHIKILPCDIKILANDFVIDTDLQMTKLAYDFRPLYILMILGYLMWLFDTIQIFNRIQFYTIDFCLVPRSLFLSYPIYSHFTNQLRETFCLYPVPFFINLTHFFYLTQNLTHFKECKMGE
jgi:hypothetical protein